MASRVCRVALPRCGVRTTFGSSSNSSGTCGSCVKTSSPARRRPDTSSAVERRLVHDLPACRVDDRSTVTQQREAPRVEEPARLRRQRGMNGDEVRLCEQLVELSKLTEVRLRTCSLRIQNTQLESLSAPGHRLPDAAEPDDAERRSGELLRQEAVGPRAAPLATTNTRVTLNDSPPHGKDQSKRQICGRRREHSRRVGHGDAPPAELLDPEPVVANAEVGHQLQLRQRSTGTGSLATSSASTSGRADSSSPRARTSTSSSSSNAGPGYLPRGENFQGTSLACRNEER